jgi:hypothetical protein
MTDTVKDKAVLKSDFATGQVITESKMSDLITSLNLVPITVDLNATNALTGSIFLVSITGDLTLENPTNAIDGQALTWYLTQDSIGGHTIALDTKFVIPDKATTPLAWSTDPNKMDILVARYCQVLDKFLVVSMVGGY